MVRDRRVLPSRGDVLITTRLIRSPIASGDSYLYNFKVPDQVRFSSFAVTIAQLSIGMNRLGWNFLVSFTLVYSILRWTSR